MTPPVTTLDQCTVDGLRGDVAYFVDRASDDYNVSPELQIARLASAMKAQQKLIDALLRRVGFVAIEASEVTKAAK